jgi:hypothetical protein
VDLGLSVQIGPTVRAIGRRSLGDGWGCLGRLRGLAGFRGPVDTGLNLLKEEFPAAARHQPPAAGSRRPYLSA